VLGGRSRDGTSFACLPGLPLLDPASDVISEADSGRTPEQPLLVGPMSFSGQPLVLAFASACGPPSPAVLASLRAELRGLGAALLCFAPSCVIHLRPDDELELSDGVHFERTAFEALLPPLPRRRQRRPPALSLAILDARGRTSWHGQAERCDDPMSTVSRALAAAGRELTRGKCQATSVTRRELLSSLAAAFALALGDACQPKPAASVDTSTAPPKAEASGAHVLPVLLTINSQQHQLSLEPRTSLLDVLRERLGLTGTKKGCDHGQCGACTVLVDGQRVNSCLALAVMVRGEVTTIEGLAHGEDLHPMQAAFVEEDALQCGYCTPGQIMSAVGLLREGRAQTTDEIREQMSGNICRCGAYPNIVRAIVKARKGGA
jgi:xanthine dehydrogenase YagT iron-sulfur-binding subunit